MRLNTMIAIALAALVAVGCNGSGGDSASTSGGSNTTSNGEKKLTIAVIPKGSTHEFWKSIHEGAEKAGQELGVDIDWKGPEKEDDKEYQIKVVEDFIQKKVDGIVLAPLDDTALRPPVMEAKQEGIPTVIIDSGLKDADVVSFVATDNYKGGQMAGTEMARLLNDKGSIVMLRYAVGSASTDQREQGFLDEIKKHPGIKIVSDNQYAGPTTETAATAAESLLQPLKNSDGSLKIDGIYTPNESSTFGMLRVLQDMNAAGKVKFVGFDSSAKLLEALGNGQINALVVQNPRNMGYLGVKTLVESIRGTAKAPAKIDTGAKLVTKENMNSDEMKELLAPPKV